MKHKLTIGVSNKVPRSRVVTYKKVSPNASVKDLFKGTSKVAIIVPGDSVKSVTIEEVKEGGDENNVRWKVNKFFEEGKVWGLHDFYGYKVVGDNYEIKEEEAKVIRLIFKLYNEDGYGYQKIASILNKSNVPSPEGVKWTYSTVRNIGRNITYTGELMLGKNSSPMNMKSENKGEFPMYHVKESHPAIISKEEYQKAQNKEIKNRVKFIKETNPTSPFYGLIKCASCSRNYVRKTNKYRAFYICSAMSNRDATNCSQTLSIREDTLLKLTSEALGVPISKIDRALLETKLDKIAVHQSKDVDFVFKSGEIMTLHFEFKSRKESWTAEMKEPARRRELERLYGKSNN